MKKACFSVVFLLCATFSGGAAFADCASDLARLQAQEPLQCTWQTQNPAAGGVGIMTSIGQLTTSSEDQCVASCSPSISFVPTVTSTGTYYFYTSYTCSWIPGGSSSINCGVYSSFVPS